MIDATLASLRNSSEFFNTKEILHIYDGRKKEDLGYFVPKYFQKEFEAFVKDLEDKKKHELLQKVAKAQAKDPIEEGSENDGLH
jgi:hypothetical protein